MEKKTIEEHLLELRRRLLAILIFFVIFSIVGFLLSDLILGGISRYLLLKNVKLIAIHPMDYLYVKINVSFFFGIFLTSPIIIYQVFAFVKPGLFEHEKKLAAKIVVLSFLLFLGGTCFFFFVLLKFTLWFLATLSSVAGVENLWNVNSFFTFVTQFSLTGGVTFQLPLVILLLVKSGLVSVESLRKARAYVVVLSFLIAGIVTPTVDPFCQALVALPILGLYELSILLGKFMKK